MAHKLTLLLCCMAAIATAQKTITIGSFGGNYDYNHEQFQDALDAAQDGDIIQIHPGNYNTKSYTIRKRVILRGPGYYLSENATELGLSPVINTGIALFGNIALDDGADQSVISGLSMNGIFLDSVSNVLIERNKMSSVYFENKAVSNVTIRKNYILGDVRSSSSGKAVVVTSIQISNNYISGGFFAPSPYYFNSASSFSVFNNIIAGGRERGLYLYNTYFRNNIFLNSSSIGCHHPSSANNRSSNNVFVATADKIPSYCEVTTANGNVVGVTLSDIFVGKTGNSTDGQWRLKAGSPAKGIGVGGVDAGMYGGTDPYRLSGVGDIPFVTDLVVPDNVNTNDKTIQVSIKAKSGNE